MGSYGFFTDGSNGTGSPESFSVTTPGTYNIVAYGGSGGNASGASDGFLFDGGKGAKVGGEFNLIAGERLKIFVGSAGGSAQYSGGGGGSFVLGSTDGGASYAPLLVAGGGGGATATFDGAMLPGGAALGSKGAAGYTTSSTTATGNGLGGAAGTVNGSTLKTGAGGAGINGHGTNSAGYAVTGGTSVTAANSPGLGGFGSNGTFGGFGGGGGSGYTGGGGGGFTGGNAGSLSSNVGPTPSQGGTSFDAGTPITADDVSGAEAGDGLVKITLVCYAAGTRIRMTRGDVAVEHLAVGDLAITVSGAHRPIRWLGHCAVDCRGHAAREQVLPIRITAHAFGADRPARDLTVSPGHAICIDLLGEVLIPAAALVDGVMVRQIEVDTVTYWHVELDSHDVILAENLAAESYLDMGNRGFFREARVVDLAAGPDAESASRTHSDFCRPFHADGPVVEAVRKQVHARAVKKGWRLQGPLAEPGKRHRSRS